MIISSDKKWFRLPGKANQTRERILLIAPEETLPGHPEEPEKGLDLQLRE